MEAFVSAHANQMIVWKRTFPSFNTRIANQTNPCLLGHAPNVEEKVVLGDEAEKGVLRDETGDPTKLRPSQEGVLGHASSMEEKSVLRDETGDTATPSSPAVPSN